MKLWRSEALPWIALGAAFTSLIVYRMAQPDQTPRQNFYASREQCLRDYEEYQCRVNGGAVSGYHGPYYRGERQTANDPGPGRTAAADGRSAAATRVVRGGFSSTARSGYGGYRGG